MVCVDDQMCLQDGVVADNQSEGALIRHPQIFGETRRRTTDWTRMMWGRLCAWMTESVATTTATLHRTCLRHIPIFVYATFRSLQPPPPRMTSSFASGVIECKGLEIRPIRGGYMLTNQRRVSVDQSERRSSKFDQSEPSSRMRMRGTLLTV